MLTEIQKHEIKTVLTCLKETSFVLDSKRLMNVLKGQETTFNKIYNLKEGETFGALKAKNDHDLKMVVERAINLGLVESYRVDPFSMASLRITKRGYYFLNHGAIKHQFVPKAGIEKKMMAA